MLIPSRVMNFLVNFFCLFKNYPKKFTKKFVTLDEINISGCSIYFLIGKFMLFDLKIISKFYVYCASRSDLWRPNDTAPN